MTRLLALCALLSAASCYLALGSPESGSAPRDPATSIAGPVVGTRHAITTERWVVGEQRTYRLSSTRTLVSAGNELTFELGGTWRVSVTDRDADAVQLRCVLDKPSLRIDGRAAPARLLSGLAAPLHVRADLDGRVESVAFSPVAGAFARMLLKSVVADTQVAGADGGSVSWTAREDEPTGRYVAEYQRVGTDRIRKQKRRFVRVTSVGGQPLPADLEVRVLRSRTDIELDAHRVARLELTEAVRFHAGRGLDFEGRVHTRLELLDTSRVDVATAPASWTFVALATVEGSAAETAAQHDAQLLDGATYEALVRDLSAGEDSLRYRALVRMRSLFRLEPEAALQAIATLREATDAQAAGALLGALSSAGTPESQVALSIAAADPEVPSTTRRSAVQQLGLSEAPTAATADSLREQLDGEHGGVAALAAGRVARERGDASLVETLLDRLESAEGRRERVAALHALGNTGDASALPALETALDDAEPAVRAAAASALRFVEDADADALLGAALADTDRLVRRRALAALAERDIVPVLDALERLLEVEPSAGVRLRAVQLLARHVDASPGVVELLMRVAARDPSPSVRASAARRV